MNPQIKALLVQLAIAAVFCTMAYLIGRCDGRLAERRRWLSSGR